MIKQQAIVNETSRVDFWIHVNIQYVCIKILKIILNVESQTAPCASATVYEITNADLSSHTFKHNFNVTEWNMLLEINLQEAIPFPQNHCDIIILVFNDMNMLVTNT